MEINIKENFAKARKMDMEFWKLTYKVRLELLFKYLEMISILAISGRIKKVGKEKCLTLMEMNIKVIGQMIWSVIVFIDYNLDGKGEYKYTNF